MNKDHTEVLTYLKIARVQIEEIMKMMEEDIYCIDVSDQLISVHSILKKTNILILKQHLVHCVKDTIKEEEGDDKLDELIGIIEKTIQK